MIKVIIYIHIYTHMCIYVHIYVQMYIYDYIHIHTYIWSKALWCSRATWSPEHWDHRMLSIAEYYRIYKIPPQIHKHITLLWWSILFLTRQNVRAHIKTFQGNTETLRKVVSNCIKCRAKLLRNGNSWDELKGEWRQSAEKGETSWSLTKGWYTGDSKSPREIKLKQLSVKIGILLEKVLRKEAWLMMMMMMISVVVIKGLGWCLAQL